MQKADIEAEKLPKEGTEEEELLKVSSEEGEISWATEAEETLKVT